MNQHPPGFTRYIGLDERTQERIFAVMSGPHLPPPIPHARLIAKAPEMLEILADLTQITAEYIAYGEKMREFGRGFSTVGKLGHEDKHILRQTRALLREIEGEP